MYSSTYKALRSRDHKSKWRTIKADDIEFMLDETGKLIDKFPKHKPRKYLTDLQTYQNNNPVKTNSPVPAAIQKKDQDPLVDSSTNAMMLDQGFSIFDNYIIDDQDDSSDFFLGFEFDDQVIN